MPPPPLPPLLLPYPGQRALTTTATLILSMRFSVRSRLSTPYRLCHISRTREGSRRSRERRRWSVGLYYSVSGDLWRDVRYARERITVTVSGLRYRNTTAYEGSSVHGCTREHKSLDIVVATRRISPRARARKVQPLCNFSSTYRALFAQRNALMRSAGASESRTFAAKQRDSY